MFGIKDLAEIISPCLPNKVITVNEDAILFQDLEDLSFIVEVSIVDCGDYCYFSISSDDGESDSEGFNGKPDDSLVKFVTDSIEYRFQEHLIVVRFNNGVVDKGLNVMLAELLSSELDDIVVIVADDSVSVDVDNLTFKVVAMNDEGIEILRLSCSEGWIEDFEVESENYGASAIGVVEAVRSAINTSSGEP